MGEWKNNQMHGVELNGVAVDVEMSCKTVKTLWYCGILLKVTDI